MTHTATSDTAPREPVFSPGTTYRTVTEQVARIPLAYPLRRRWLLAMLASIALVFVLIMSIVAVFWSGVGIWGINDPVQWGFAISNYVWWIGIGNAGTLISALLLLLAQDWRNSLNRFAEAMTLFAVTCAVMLPILHLGRPWLFYWLIPYPNVMNVWPQFRSPLVWDMFANVIYLAVSLLFFYIGLIPDLAVVRDRARSRTAQVFYGVLALGWRGAASHWVLWRKAYRTIAALAVPLVVSVHSGVGTLFAVGPQAGWHTTIFPPFFVVGAMFSGFAVVAMIAVVLRRTFALEDLVTPRHLDALGLALLASGLATGYGYMMEVFNAWYAADIHETETLLSRLRGEYAWSFWLAVGLNFIPLQALWWRAVRLSPLLLFLISTSVAVGMWMERYMLLFTTLYRDFLPSSWGFYSATFWDWSLFAGTIGLFFFLFLLFVRFLPMISTFEVKELIHKGVTERRDAGS